MNCKLAVLAIGGNSLIKDKSKIALSYQYEAVKETSVYLADLIEDGMNMVITHGNGPQVGFIYRRGELSIHELPLIPLDICGADTQGAIGYMIEKALLNQFRKRGIKKPIVAVVTQTVVDRDDPKILLGVLRRQDIINAYIGGVQKSQTGPHPPEGSIVF